MKNIDYYSKAEDIRFSNLVLYYNSLEFTNEEKEILGTKIKDRTQILIYELCIRNLFLTEDEATEIYLELRPSVEDIIASYTISTRSYNIYILQICRFRSLYLARRKFEKKRHAEGILKDIELSYQYKSEDIDLDEIIAQRAPYYGSDGLDDVCNLDMKELFDYMVANSDMSKSNDLNEKEEKLASEISTKNNRRYMIYFLMWLPQVETPTFIESVSRVMGLDTSVLSYFYTLKYTILESKKTKWHNKRNVANKHYSTMLKICSKKFYEQNTEKIAQLEKDYQDAKRRFMNANCAARKAAAGLSQTEISKILEIKRSVVGYGLTKMKTILLAIVN